MKDAIPTDIEQRVARHDAQFDAINGRLDTIERGQREILERTKPNWSTWAAWAGVVLSVVAMVGGALGWGFQRDMSRIESILAKGIEVTLSKAEDFGYAAAIRDRLRSDVDRHRDEMRALHSEQETLIHSLHKEQDEQLQREMRILDSAMQAQINDLDKRIQNEIDLKLAPLAKDIQWLKGGRPNIQ